MPLEQGIILGTGVIYWVNWGCRAQLQRVRGRSVVKGQLGEVIQERCVLVRLCTGVMCLTQVVYVRMLLSSGGLPTTNCECIVVMVVVKVVWRYLLLDFATYRKLCVPVCCRN